MDLVAELFSGTLAGEPMPRTLVDVLRYRAARQPGSRLFSFLAHGEAADGHLTYGGLDQRARAIGAELQRMGMAGQRVLLLYQPSLDYVAAFMGCLYGGVVAVPSYPPDPFRMERTFPRFHAIVTDSGASGVLTTGAILDLAGELLDEHPDFQGLARLATDTIPDHAAEAWRPPGVDASTVAFLQYTSGSTAQPKGVILTHRNLMANLALIYESFAVRPGSSGMIWLPPYHDMGLIGGILQPIYGGLTVALMSPLDFLQRPLRWLQAMTSTRATISGGPNFAYDLCVRKISAEQRATLDLSAWEVAFNGAEPVRKDTIERFCQAFADCGFRKEAFYPCYGLAEATLIASGGDQGCGPVYLTVDIAALAEGEAQEATAIGPGAAALVGAGHTLGGQRIAIADPETLEELPDSRVGEIWVSGDSVADGYWGRPKESAAPFQAVLADGGAGPVLRSGDLGFLRDGELFVTGRIKDLIIVDGRNHYPQDIELTVEASHPALRPGCSAAFPVAVDGQERLVVAVEVAKQYRPMGTDGVDPGRGELLDGQAVRAAIRRAVAGQHDLRAHAVVLLAAGSIPKTSSGKIQRHACREGYLAGTLEGWDHGDAVQPGQAAPRGEG
jgi:acyl-CoA synthetase (AMP-forming)/AMP-acid ligase II